MKNLKIHIKHPISPAAAMVRFTILLALLSYSATRLESSVSASRESSLDLARQTTLRTTTNGQSPDSPASKLYQPTQARSDEAYGKMPLYFVENRGQVDSRVAYYVRGKDKSVYFTPDGVTFLLTARAGRPAADESSPQLAFVRPVASRLETGEGDAMQQLALRLDFLGARPGVRPIGQEPTSATINYFTGTRDQWKTGLKTFSTVLYPDLWPGIDLIYTGTVNKLKYTFLLKPGADPGRIRLAYRGASRIGVDDEGQLEVSTPAGDLHDDKPYSYQDLEGQRVEVTTAYALDSNPNGRTQTWSFQVGDYDRTKPLVIDPATFIYSGFIGGPGDDVPNGIAVDLDENAYIVGSTDDAGGAFPPALQGRVDVFVAKVDRNGALVFADFIGGDENDIGNAIAVDKLTEEIFITGATQSGPSFPGIIGPVITPTVNGSEDAFVARLDDTGGLQYSRFIGGTRDALSVGNDEGRGIAIDEAGNAYVTGVTTSHETSFPTGSGFGLIPGLDQKSRFGGARSREGFAVKVTADGTGLSYATYIGDAGGITVGNGIAIDRAGNACIVGVANSKFPDPPLYPSPGASNLQPAGGFDAFVLGLNTNGDGARFLAFIGGDGHEEGKAVALDDLGNIYITGITDSDESSFPVSVGPSLAFGGFADAFVARILADGVTLDYAGYIGGANEDGGFGIAVDSDRSAYVTGWTKSSRDSGFPVFNVDGTGVRRFNRGLTDAFVSKVRADGLGFVYSGLIGGEGQDEGASIAVTVSGKAFITGTTNSSKSSFPVKGGPSEDYGGGFRDTFVAKIVNVSRPDSGIGTELDLGLFGPPTPILVPIGNIIVMPILVSNLGTETATKVSVVGVLPGSLIFLSCSSMVGTCESGPNNSFLAAIPTLAPGQSETIAVRAIVDCSVPDGTLISNTVLVGASGFDINPKNNSMAVTLVAVRPQFQVCLKDDVTGDTLRFNSLGDYQLTVVGPGGFTVTGSGRVTVSGCTIQLVATSSDSNSFAVSLQAQLNTCANMGVASVELNPGISLTVTDSNTADNNCGCP
ncbi:MAG TPA: SBBP repeat-containing protein [Blastocatellia bacterium]|nr:SBBP repeat-containing protein [Blastocatellia bacterium]